jgi:hypothetical protein
VWVCCESGFRNSNDGLRGMKEGLESRITFDIDLSLCQNPKWGPESVG